MTFLTYTQLQQYLLRSGSVDVVLRISTTPPPNIVVVDSVNFSLSVAGGEPNPNRPILPFCKLILHNIITA